MKKRELTNYDLEQLFDSIIEQKPLMSEDQVNSLLQQLPVATTGGAARRFFLNHLNTLILGALVLGLAATLLWINQRPEIAKTMPVINQPKEKKVAEIPSDTLPVQSIAIIVKDSLQEPLSVDSSLNTSPTIEVPQPILVDSTYSLSDIYKHFEKQPQQYIIDTGRDTMIFCKEGTSVKIKANSLVSAKTGKLITGKAQLQVKEYYKLSDMIMSKLTTSSNAEILETGGMINITAMQDQEKCLIRQGQAIEIGFPYSVKKEDMALFNGEWKNGHIDWTPAITVTDVKITATVIGKEEEPLPTYVEQMPVFRQGNAALQEYLQQGAHYPFSVLKDKIKGIVLVGFVVEKDGTTSNIYVRGGLNSTLDKVAVYLVSNLPKWIPARQNGQTVRIQNTLPVFFNPKYGELTNEEILQSKELEEKIKDIKVSYLNRNQLTNEEFKEEFEQKLQENDFQKATVSDVNRYVLSASQLGWINCDRFLRDNSKRTDYSIRIDQPDSAIVSMVFHRFKSLMPGVVEAGRFRYKNVPMGEKVTIVAIKTMGGKIQLAIKETVVSAKEETDLVFQQVTMELLKKEMDRLNQSISN